MLYFLISFVSFLILSKSFTTSKPLSNGLWMNLSSFQIFGIKKGDTGFNLFEVPLNMPLKTKKVSASKVEDEDEDEDEDEGERVNVSLLDLPELPLERILERLSPAELCKVAAVCTYLRDRSRSDYLWEKHMKRKWGEVIGDSAYRQWQCHTASRNKEKIFNHPNQKGLFASLLAFSRFLWIQSKSEDDNCMQSISHDSVMALYVSLTTGKFWFPAQVYNRENGHAGFMLSCYDAQLCYDSRTDSFQARYSPNGRWAIEENIEWDRLRMPPIDISPHALHISHSFADLRPGDHIEIQWRRNMEFPYGWWYGVIGHLESCPGHGNHCHCHLSDTVILEFKQYSPGSRWRKAEINRKHHREEGNEVDGFYGGIRKLQDEEEITRWNTLWPTRIVE